MASCWLRVSRADGVLVGVFLKAAFTTRGDAPVDLFVTDYLSEAPCNKLIFSRGEVTWLKLSFMFDIGT